MRVWPHHEHGALSAVRRPGITPELLKKAPTAATLYRAKTTPVDEIARQLSISKPTLYKLLKHEGVEISPYKKIVTAIHMGQKNRHRMDRSYMESVAWMHKGFLRAVRSAICTATKNGTA